MTRLAGRVVIVIVVAVALAGCHRASMYTDAHIRPTTLERCDEDVTDCEHGKTDRCLPAGECLDGIARVRDAPRALRALDRACRRKEALACRRAGWLRLLGDGVPVDVPTGLLCVDRSCALDEKYCHSAAVVHLGSWLPVPADQPRAQAVARRWDGSIPDEVTEGCPPPK